MRQEVRHRRRPGGASPSTRTCSTTRCSTPPRPGTSAASSRRRRTSASTPSAPPREPAARKRMYPGPRALLPGGGLAAHLQQRDPALLDEAERAGLGARCPRSSCASRTPGGEDVLTPAAPMTSPWSTRRDGSRWPCRCCSGMSVLVFGLMRLVPGDPAAVVLGYKATPEAIRALREAFHLDEPVAAAVPPLARRGGPRRLRPRLSPERAHRPDDPRPPARDARADAARRPLRRADRRAARTARAAAGGAARADRAALAVGLVGVSIPDFWLGIMLILLLSLGAGLLPSGGFVPFAESPARRTSSTSRCPPSPWRSAAPPCSGG